MPVEPSDVSCPDCGRRLQVIYATELRQIVSGYACAGCGFAASQKEGLASVPLAEPREYLLRIEKPLSADDVRDSVADVREEFRARASESMAPDELWLLIDREEDVVVDLLAGDERPHASTSDRDADDDTPGETGESQ